MLWSISVIDDILHDSLSVCLLLLILSLFSLFPLLTVHHILATKSSRSGNLRETSPRHHLILSIIFSPLPSEPPHQLHSLSVISKADAFDVVKNLRSRADFPRKFSHDQTWKQPPTENAPSNFLATPTQKFSPMGLRTKSKSRTNIFSYSRFSFWPRMGVPQQVNQRGGWCRWYLGIHSPGNRKDVIYPKSIAFC